MDPKKCKCEPFWYLLQIEKHARKQSRSEKKFTQVWIGLKSGFQKPLIIFSCNPCRESHSTFEQFEPSPQSTRVSTSLLMQAGRNAVLVPCLRARRDEKKSPFQTLLSWPFSPTLKEALGFKVMKYGSSVLWSTNWALPTRVGWWVWTKNIRVIKRGCYRARYPRRFQNRGWHLTFEEISRAVSVFPKTASYSEYTEHPHFGFVWGKLENLPCQYEPLKKPTQKCFVLVSLPSPCLGDYGCSSVRLSVCRLSVDDPPPTWFLGACPETQEKNFHPWNHLFSWI